MPKTFGLEEGNMAAWQEMFVDLFFHHSAYGWLEIKQSQRQHSFTLDTYNQIDWYTEQDANNNTG